MYDVATILLLTHIPVKFLVFSVSVAVLAGLIFVAVLVEMEKERRHERR